MKERSEALKLLEEFKTIHQRQGLSVEVAIRAIAIQAAIFERLSPAMWAVAYEDALTGMSTALPETEQ